MKLEIGSGFYPHEGYQHLDINPDLPCVEYVASMFSIPLPDSSVEEILCINSLEHLEWTDIKRALQEWARVVMPGGKVVIHVPDISFLPVILDYESNEWQKDIGEQPFNAKTDRWEYLNHYVMGTCAPFNQHRTVFTQPMLEALLINVGFGNFERIATDRRWLYLSGVKQ
jgi:predicted SAM-dependent methyltransferase